jgi:hypothetical protein
MAIMLIPSKVITDALAKSRRYARRYKSCQGWSPAKKKRMIAGKSFTFIGRIYKGMKFKAHGDSCDPYADKALAKLVKAEETFEKYKRKKDWGPKKRKKYENQIKSAKKYVYKKLGLNKKESDEIEGHVFRAARTRAKVAEGQPLPAEMRADLIRDIRVKLGTDAPPTVTSMSDAELLDLEEVADLQEDVLIEEMDAAEGFEAPELSIEGITDWATDRPLMAVGAAGVTVAGVLLLANVFGGRRALFNSGKRYATGLDAAIALMEEDERRPLKKPKKRKGETTAGYNKRVKRWRSSVARRAARTRRGK